VSVSKSVPKIIKAKTDPDSDTDPDPDPDKSPHRLEPPPSRRLEADTFAGETPNAAYFL
jgi:hypothetical protein